MPRRTPTTTKTVFAIGDVTMLVRARLAADGVLDADDLAVLRRLDGAAYLAGKADLDRRRRNAVEDLGEIPARLSREERELEHEYAHVALQAG